jgi:response regulator RpfG family c-di-GMP phosphodiesterase
MPDYSDRADRVVQASFWIGSRFGMERSQLHDLVYAARLREIGKLGLPDRILFTPRHQRTKEEQGMYDRYPSYGARVMREVTSLHDAAKIVEFHLECFDGSGEAGLISNQIPLGSRILRVASAFEMIAADSRMFSTEDILRVLDHGRSSLYDPQLVRLMENYVHLTAGGTIVSSETQRVRLSELTVGMVLAEDIWSRAGIKIVSRGTLLNEHVIQVLMSLPLDASIEYIEVKRAS